MASQTSDSSRIKKSATDFCLTTSAHGVNHVISAKDLVKKAAWILILSGVMIGCSFHLYELISSYLDYHYYTSITNEAAVPLKVQFS